ncbi:MULTISPECIES: ATP-binding protein [unclassified Pseudoalteromonas]|uniref:ATP-binding protein n=1 Tax=unclassified Pseudoalteromonas TaxID=194690 RepID=UPI002096833A|nr:ATP-binding protein [Pseudoalteromonas sp. XMcav2-N]MCO7188548.1 ATP-binding protein [Pseudoalteromonas sp. XMcav2-N]
MTYSSEQNLAALYMEMDWLFNVVNQVICNYLKQEGHEHHWFEIPPPEFEYGMSAYGDLVRDWELNTFERLALAVAMAPAVKPDVLDILFGVNQLIDKSFSEFGGVSDKAFGGFVPTGQTVCFLISGNDPLWRVQADLLLSSRHRFMSEQVTELLPAEPSLPHWAGVYKITEHWFSYFLTGIHTAPELSTSFPAHAMETPHHWHDLVLDYAVMKRVDEIRAWLEYGAVLMDEWQLGKKVKPGYRAVFFGPPGTGKTMTAALLAKTTEREIYRVDLSMVVSKYIGETEKNLSRVFDVASYKNWILFFDEADSLFGKRTATSSSNDRHANQLTGYLLQRIEDFPGTVILATNLRANMDEAFTRRFQNMVQFTIPGPHERLKLWQNAFSQVCELDEDIDLERIATDFELSGGQIINILRQCALNAIRRDERRVYQADLLESIRQELQKDNKTINSSILERM